MENNRYYEKFISIFLFNFMAKKFRFRLETILKIRTEKTKEAKTAMNIALRNRYEKETEIETLQNIKKEQLKKQTVISKAQDMQTIKDYIANLDNQIEYKEKEKEKLIEIENVRRTELNEAMKEEKIIAKLKEKKLEKHKSDVKIEEDNFLNEVAIQQYIRKS